MTELLFETLERVRTYKILKWNYRSIELFHPYYLALQGYQCVSFDVIECSICKNRVEFSSEVDNSQFDFDYGAIQNQIKQHSKDCLYYNLEADETNYKKILSQGKFYLNLDLINQKCQPIGKIIKSPVLNTKAFWARIQEAQKVSMMKTVLNKCEMNHQTFIISFVLKFFGWTFRPQQIQNQSRQELLATRLQCFFCGANILIEDYYCVSNDRQPENILEQEANLFNPTEGHRYFCIWNNEYRGWELWLQHLWDKIGEVKEIFKKENPQAVKKIRVNLDKYLQSFCASTKQEFEKINKIFEICKNLCEHLQEKEGLEKEEVEKEEVHKRERMFDFLEDIDQGIRAPLKNTKID